MSNIGFFDSGLGGLSILELALDQLPHHDYVYLADTANNPYGEKEGAWIRERGLALVEHLSRVRGCSIIVVACNTATAEAIQDIRLHFPHLRVLGVEPGIKPATLQTKTKSIGILATKATLESKKFNDLISTMPRGFDFLKIPGTGLVELIEETSRDPFQIQRWLETHLLEFRSSQADTLVLGCTHYPFIIDLLHNHLSPHIQLVHTGQAVVNHLSSHLHPVDVSMDAKVSTGSLHLLCNVDASLLLSKAQKLLKNKAMAHASTEFLTL